MVQFVSQRHKLALDFEVVEILCECSIHYQFANVLANTAAGV